MDGAVPLVCAASRKHVSINDQQNRVRRRRRAEWRRWNISMNVTCLTDENGDALERYHYDPYGNVTMFTGGWGARSSSSYDNSVLFCGYWRDKETGLYCVRRCFHRRTLDR